MVSALDISVKRRKMLEMWLSQVFAVDKWYFDKDILKKKKTSATKGAFSENSFR